MFGGVLETMPRSIRITEREKKEECLALADTGFACLCGFVCRHLFYFSRSYQEGAGTRNRESLAGICFGFGVLSLTWFDCDFACFAPF